MKVEKMVPGQVLYSVQKRGMGNTTMSTICVYAVSVKEVDAERGRVFASWNNNPARWFMRRDAEKWRVSKPVLVTTGLGYRRLATREEIKALTKPTDTGEG